ncbi:Putative GATA zinc finger domain-containing protein 10 [Rhizopus microsporus]|nr:hypothetical protein RMATCC62417_13317 [Rhizopus microsporus]CEG78758.1 Putative GATA zinc finger domain-containing protein 10 [Rhizopus microsporus]
MLTTYCRDDYIYNMSNKNVYASDVNLLDGRSVINPQQINVRLPSISELNCYISRSASSTYSPYPVVSQQSVRATGRITKKHRNSSSFTSQKVTFPLKCHSCQSTETPEWRKGPLGPRTLCNACGLSKFRYMGKMFKKGDEELGGKMKKKEGEEHQME